MELLLGSSGDIDYVIYRNEHLDGVKKVIFESFIHSECLCVATEVNRPESLRARQEFWDYTVEALRDGVSIVAVDRTSKQVVAHAINTIHMRGPPDAPAFCNWYRDDYDYSDSTRAQIAFMFALDKKINLFDHYQIDCLFECMFLGMLPSYVGQHIGRHLVAYSVQLAKQINRGKYRHLLSEEIRANGTLPTIVSAIFTGVNSQRIGRQLGFVEHAEIEYEDLQYKGMSFAQRINNPIHKSAVLMAIPI